MLLTRTHELYTYGETMTLAQPHCIREPEGLVLGQDWWQSLTSSLEKLFPNLDSSQ